MNDLDVSRRDLLKSAATGAATLGLLGAAAVWSDRYLVGARSPGAVSAAASVSDAGHSVIELGDRSVVSGVYPEGVRRSLLQREDVAYVQPDRRLQTMGSGGDADRAPDGTLPWGIDRIDAEVAHGNGATGEGIDVAIIDTGIDGRHPVLEDNVAEPGDGAHRAWEECEGDDCDHPWSDDGGHGTHVSGTVAAVEGDAGVVGVAPEVTLHALKVCNGAGFCSTSDIVAAVKFAADQGWEVANLSLGSPSESPALEDAGQYAADQGTLLVAAAGNRGPCDDCVGYPAAYDEYVAVSATSIDDSLAEFSSTGPEVDLAAPGEDVCSTVPGGHGTFSGTSMASPHVAGTAAQLRAEGYSVEEAREQLRESAEGIGLDDPEEGSGLVDAAAALDMDSGDDGTGDGTDCPS